MARHGFILDIKDVKVLILYVMSLVEKPVSAQTIYELCYQDDSLSYFDVQEAIPQMVISGHLAEVSDGMYQITQKGRDAQPLTEDALAYPMKHRAEVAVDRLNQKKKREKFLRTEILKREKGDIAVHMGLDDEYGSLMELELMAPTLEQARRLEAAYLKNADMVYQAVMVGLLEEIEE